MENLNLTVRDIVNPKTHKHLIKVYVIRITSFQKGGIWYTKKVGCEYYAVLASKEIGMPIFRLVNINEARTYLTPMVLYLDVYPTDCLVVDEFIVRSNSTLKHLHM